MALKKNHRKRVTGGAELRALVCSWLGLQLSDVTKTPDAFDLSVSASLGYTSFYGYDMLPCTTRLPFLHPGGVRVSSRSSHSRAGESSSKAPINVLFSPPWSELSHVSRNEPGS